MEPPYSYLQVDIQEHPTPIEFPPPFSIEEFNLYHHHAYPPHMNYDKNALYMNHLSLSGNAFPNGSSRSNHKSKGHSAKHQQHHQHQSQQHQHPNQQQHPQHHHHQQQQPHQHQQHPQQQQHQQQQHQQQQQQHQPQQPSPAHPQQQNPAMTKDVKPNIYSKDSQQGAPPVPASTSAASSDASSKQKHSSPTVPEEPIKNLSVKQLVRAKHTLQQRIKRQNETPEQQAARRLRNAELNRKRRQNKEDIRVTIEKTKNRLRQRIKREIDRMLRTRQKRDDFLRETFEQMGAVFSDEDMMQYQERVANVLWEISKGGSTAPTTTTGSDTSRATSSGERRVS